MDNAGFEGFYWWFGLVEDIEDPLKLGRARVRIFNIHSQDAARVRTEDLPWAHVIMPVTSASFNQVGTSPTFLTLNSTVFGFFADANEKQKPLILGTLPGIPQPDPENVDPNNISDDNHDVSKLARGDNKLGAIKDSYKDADFEPGSLYAAKYPHNKVVETTSGHVIELDDTPGAERIHVYHKNGSFIEIGNEVAVYKTNGTEVNVCMVDKAVKVKGNMVVSVDGDVSMQVKGNMGVEVDGAFRLAARSVDISSKVSTEVSSLVTTSLTGPTVVVGGEATLATVVKGTIVTLN